jgi:hypothetical protein
MRRRITTLLTVTAGLSTHAAAQSYTADSSITMTMSWSEVNSSGWAVPNPDGILEPGEYALVLINSVSFTNQGGAAAFSPAIGGHNSGVITGFGGGFVDVVGSGGTVGMFNTSNPMANSNGISGFGIRGDWRVDGVVVNAASDGLIDVTFAQFPATPADANTANPIPRMLRFLWQPGSFAPRTARFDLQPPVIAGNNISAVYLDFGDNTGSAIYVVPANLNLGGVSIPIAPAPPTLALAAAAVAFGSRRCRPA